MEGNYSLGDLMTIEQTAEKLHVAVRTVRDWRYKRKIPFTRVGRRLYVGKGVVEGLLAANEIPALPSSGPPGSMPVGQGGAEKGKSK
jgi:excisionase family DNA binding protein